MRDIEGQLLPIVDQFQTMSFDPAHCHTYKEGLCEWVDAQLVQELAKVGGATLGAMHDQAQTRLIGECADLWTASWSVTLPSDLQTPIRACCSCRRTSCPGSTSWSVPHS